MESRRGPWHNPLTDPPRHENSLGNCESTECKRLQALHGMMTRKSRPKADDAFQMKFFQVTAKYWHKVEGFLNITILHTFRSKTIFFGGCKEFNIHIREHFQLRGNLAVSILQ